MNTNHFLPNDPDQATLHYGDGDYAIIKPGLYVLCALTKSKIPLESLRYWNPVTQEAYRGPEEAMIRWKTLNP